MSEISRANLLSHACVHFVTDRANLLADHRMSGYILMQYGSKLLTIHLYFPILLFWFGDRPRKDQKPWQVAQSFCLPIRNTIPRIFEHVLPCRGTTLKFSARGLAHPGNFSGAPAEIRDSNILLYCPRFFRLVCSPFECILSKRDQEMMLALQCPRLSST